MTASIHWVNHASFVFEHEDLRIMSDPWLFGSAFNNGWDLLCETRFHIEDFADITHIWFSHEHPDHFSPPVLRQIPQDIRKGITVLFQETKDKKVIGYCQGLGFQVRELPNHQTIELTPHCQLTCGKVPFLDSWLLIETEETKVLNANDCVVDGEGIASEIVDYTGQVDLLLTQFSYAMWEGNPNQIELRRASAAEKLQRVKLQIETFRPQYTIPFASFVYFSHAENFYNNDAINTIRTAFDFIQKTSTKPIVLFPEERWEIGQPHDNEASLAAYDPEYELESKPLHESESIPAEKLTVLGRRYIERMQSKNSPLLMRLLSLPPLRYFESLRLYLTDLDVMVQFDMRYGVQQAALSTDQAHALLSSESLAYIFRHDWGFDTLTVNGRFQATQSDYKRLVKTFFLGPLNNTGRYLRLSALFEPSFIARALSKLRSLG